MQTNRAMIEFILDHTILAFLIIVIVFLLMRWNLQRNLKANVTDFPRKFASEKVSVQFLQLSTRALRELTLTLGKH